MRQAVVESGRRSCGALFDVRRVRLWRAMERDTVRNIAIEVWKTAPKPAELVFL